MTDFGTWCEGHRQQTEKRGDVIIIVIKNGVAEATALSVESMVTSEQELWLGQNVALMLAKLKRMGK